MGHFTSKISSKSQTVIPRDVREKLGLRPGDTLSYRYTENGVVIDKVEPVDADESLGFDPFADWWEWATPEDEEAFAHLQPK